MSDALVTSPISSSSLLFPPNPALTPAEVAPKGGILINVQRATEPLNPNIPAQIDHGAHRTSLEQASPTTPITPLPSATTSSQSNTSPTTAASPTASSKARIRFAPLPDPHRPRSLSTGRNVVWKASLAANGERTRAIAIRGNNETPLDYDDDNDIALADQDGVEQEGDVELTGKRDRKWSKTMSMSGSWKGTKKLLGYSDTKEKDLGGYNEGAPLKKSVSTGGFIGS